MYSHVKICYILSPPWQKCTDERDMMLLMLTQYLNNFSFIRQNKIFFLTCLGNCLYLINVFLWLHLFLAAYKNQPAQGIDRHHQTGNSCQNKDDHIDPWRVRYWCQSWKFVLQTIKHHNEQTSLFSLLFKLHTSNYCKYIYKLNEGPLPHLNPSESANFFVLQ